MFILKNKLVSALIAINIVFFAIIYFLLVKNDKPIVNQVTSDLSQPPSITENNIVEPVESIVSTNNDAIVEATVMLGEKVQTETISQSIQRVVNAEIPPEHTIEPVDTTTPETTRKTTNEVDVYYDGKIVRMEETDSQGNRHTTISNSLDDIGKLSKNDSDYISALNEMERGNLSHVSFSTNAPITAKNQSIKEPTSDESIDHFNKVDISSQKVESTSSKITLAQQIENVLAGAEDTTDKTTNISNPSDTADYIAILDTASKERANEMRTITVKRGDTLWVISRRAYGTGFQYPKIYKANPHLTNPNKIEVGDILRVPL